MKTKRLDPDIRKHAILQAALSLSEQKHYLCVERNDIARLLEVAGSTINHHYGTMVQLRRAVMREAIRVENVKVVAQGLLQKDPHAMKANAGLIEKAKALLSNA